MARFAGRVEAQIVSGGKGHSAVSKAAYNARCELENERLGSRDDYSRKSAECMFSGIYAPKDAPEWTRDREQLWNHVEAFEFGKRRDAQLAREFQIALPHELTAEQNRYALQDFIRDNFTRKGLIADLAIHAPDRHGDQRNIHAHLMVVLRRLDGTEFVATKDRPSSAERKAELDGWKRSLEHHLNRHLERHGFEPYYDLRSLEERGIEAEPTIHMGKQASALERDGVETERGQINRDIEERNRVREELRELEAELARQAANENEATPAIEEPAVEAEPERVPTPDRDDPAPAPDFIEASRRLSDALRDFAQEDRDLGASRSMADTLRGFAEQDRHHEAEPEPDHLQARRQWAETLRGFADEPAQDRREASRDAPGHRARDRAQERAEAAQQPENDLSRLREFVRAGWEKVSSLAQRMEAAWEAIRQRHRLEDERKPGQGTKRPGSNPLRLDPEKEQASPPSPRHDREDPAERLIRAARAHDAEKRANETPEQRKARERLQEMLRRRDDGRERGHER
jgi:hypothetical protein